MAVTDTPDFNKIAWFARRAKLAYESEAEIRRQLNQVTRVNMLANIEVQYFIEMVPEQNAQLVSVRGTANMANAKEDAEFIKTRDPRLNIYVHKGFERDAMAVYEDLLPHLDRSLTIIVTGHSLGAAIATLLMMLLHHDGFKLSQSINFGQPKLTNKQGVEKYDFLPLLRIVNNEDLVPLVPPENLLDVVHGVYEHLGEELILLDGPYYVPLSAPRAKALSRSDFWKNFGHESVADHSMDKYLKSIEDKCHNARAVAYEQRHRLG